MEQIVYFTSYNQGIITLTPSGISKATYKEASAPGGYDYQDPRTGLSFQPAGATRAFACDPGSPICLPGSCGTVANNKRRNLPKRGKYQVRGQRFRQRSVRKLEK